MGCLGCLCLPLAPSGCPWAPLGCPRAALGSPWASLGCPWAHLGCPWAPSECPWLPLACAWASFGRPWVSLETPGRPPQKKVAQVPRLRTRSSLREFARWSRRSRRSRWSPGNGVMKCCSDPPSTRAGGQDYMSSQTPSNERVYVNNDSRCHII